MACRLGSIVLSVALLGTLLAGCASTAPPGAVDQNDPYESLQSAGFRPERKARPQRRAPHREIYVRAVPEPLRDGVHNGLTNLPEPVTLANDLLQANGLHAVQTLGRVVVNSTIGLAGLIDVATPMGIPAHDEDFGETLAIYGVGEGPYLSCRCLAPAIRAMQSAT